MAPKLVKGKGKGRVGARRAYCAVLCLSVKALLCSPGVASVSSNRRYAARIIADFTCSYVAHGHHHRHFTIIIAIIIIIIIITVLHGKGAEEVPG